LASNWDASVFNRLSQLIGKIASNMHQAIIALKDFYKYIKGKRTKEPISDKIPTAKDIEAIWRMVISYKPENPLQGFKELARSLKNRKAMFLTSKEKEILLRAAETLVEEISGEKEEVAKELFEDFKRKMKIWLINKNITATIDKDVDMDTTTISKGFFEAWLQVMNIYIILYNFARDTEATPAPQPVPQVNYDERTENLQITTPASEATPAPQPVPQNIDYFINYSRRSVLKIDETKWLDDKEIRKLAKHYGIKRRVFLNVGSNHWVLQLSGPRDNSVAVYDPLTGNRTVKIKDIRAMVFTEDFKTKEVVDYIRSNNLPAEIDENGIYILTGPKEGVSLWRELTKDLKLSVTTNVHQKDGYNCGIYVVYYAMIANE
jgi:hypothetical protein